MKKCFIKTSLLSFVSSCVFVASAPAWAAETYKLDPNHTAVVWHISHFGFSNPSGKFMNIVGTLVLDEKKPENSKIEVAIPTDGGVSGVPKLDEHLKTKDFFNVEKYPSATYVSNSVEMTGKDTAKVHGKLTLLGVTKPVVLDVKLNKIGDNMMKKKTAGFTATAQIKRSDFGMTTYLPGLGDDVTLSIETEATISQP
ncbi:MAG: YceI family protein [Alphaproteobacteria bacterium]|nr:YceI family protein [Alphaproteobacteria bacterium]